MEKTNIFCYAEKSMQDQLQKLLQTIISDLGVKDFVPEVEISDDSSHGEYTSNVALRIAKQLKKSPQAIALSVIEQINDQRSKIKAKTPNHNINQTDQNVSADSSVSRVLSDIDHVEVAGPGFLNFWLTEASLVSQIPEVLKMTESANSGKTKKRVMVEFAHPNTHKAFHIGHLRNITTGESIVRLLESQGTKVIRANYQGDVGMHIAKCLYALTQISEIRNQLSKIRAEDIHKKVDFLGQAYAVGSQAFEATDEVKKEVGEINKQIYAKDPAIYPLYQETRQWSLDYFAAIYKRVGTHYDRLYFESEVYETGKKYVLEGLNKGIFIQSEGAIIFPGEKYASLPDGQGLHNRVFITKEGNTTYEGKDMGLAPLQHQEYHPDLIMHVLGPEQYGYTRVIFKALDLLFPETANRQYHRTYGWVKLKHGKMSSRTGQVVLGEWLLDEAKKKVLEILDQSIKKYSKQEQEEIAEKVAVSAVKYSFLRVGLTVDIAFDFDESVNIEGDSGPYLMYTYARCKSVLRKAGDQVAKLNDKNYTLNTEEHNIVRLITFYFDIVRLAAEELAPNKLCTYLYHLAQAFNLFYQKHSILGNSSDSSERSDQANFRLALTSAVSRILQHGLHLLGIATVEKM